MSTKPIAELGVTHFKGISVKDKGVEGKYTLVPSGAVFPDGIKLDRCKKFTGDMAKVSQKFLQPNDVLFNSGGVGTLGRSHHIDDIQPRSFVPDSFVLVLRSSGVQVLSKYLYYYLQTPSAKQLIAENTRGTIGITSIKSEAVLGFEMPCPSITEQQRIVHLLDEAFEGIAIAKANAEKNLQNARAIFQSHQSLMFRSGTPEWVDTALGDICEFVRGPFGGSLKKSNFVKEGYAVYEQQHAIYDQFDVVRYFINEAKFNEMQRFELLNGDLIMSCSGTIGRVAIVPSEFQRGVINQALLKLTPGPKILSTFLKYWMESEAFQDALRDYSGGAAIQNVASVKILKQIKVSLPTVAEQRKLVEDLDFLKDQTQRLVRVYERKLAAVDALKNSLLNRAFLGLLVTA